MVGCDNPEVNIIYYRKWFEPRNNIIRWNLTVWVKGVLRRTFGSDDVSTFCREVIFRGKTSLDTKPFISCSYDSYVLIDIAVVNRWSCSAPRPTFITPECVSR